jgi:gliding motility-associated-like protein
LKKVFVLFIFYLGLLFTTFSQNLVPNPSFEEIDSIPCKWTAVEEFNVLFKDWFQPTRGTTDVFSTYVDPSCFAHCLSTHEKAMGQQAPRTGRIVGAILTSGFGCNRYSYREYLSVRLKEKLKKNEVYYAEMYVSHMDKSNIATNNVGFYFSTDSIAKHDYFDCYNLKVTPQINEDSIIDDNINWVKVSGYFRAEEEYEYMVLGNMYNDDQTIKKELGFFGDRLENWSGKYYVDDVLVRPCLSITPDTIICNGNTIDLEAWGNPIYGWADEKSPGQIIETNSTFRVSPDITTTYLAYGYCDTLSVTVTLPEPLGDTTMCEGDSITIQLKFKDPMQIWIPDSLMYITQPGHYEIVRKMPGCIQKDTIRVDYKPKPLLDLSTDSLICKIDTIIIDVTEPGVIVKWEDDSTDPIRTITAPGLYSVEGWLEGCYNYNSVNIELEDCPTELIMPNVFTPNNDQVNDFFRPIKLDGVVSSEITILNRFGVEIFSSNSIDNYWDGKIGGQMAPTGIYYYYIQYISKNGVSENIKGSLSLIR